MFKLKIPLMEQILAWGLLKIIFKTKFEAFDNGLGF